MARVHYKLRNTSQRQISTALFAAYMKQVLARRDSMETDTAGRLCDTLAWWLTDPGKKDSLIIAGSVGVGKTTLATALGRFLAEYTNMGALVMDSNAIADGSAISDNEFYARSILHGAYPAVMLILDDVGIEPETVKSYGNIYHPFASIVETRYARRLPLVITTNLTMQEISDRYGERIYDRLIEMADRISINEESYRR